MRTVSGLFADLAPAVLVVALCAPARGQGAASLNGTTGLVNTPTAELVPDASVRFGFALIDEEWAYQGRGGMDNEIWFVSFGFLPRVEASIRATVLPDLTLIEAVDFPVVDRLASGRVLVLREGTRHPAVALGVDDLRGTRLFHSLYVVATKEVRSGAPELRVSAGWGSDVLEADRHVLDGAFGGAAVKIRDWWLVSLDYDTEKWNHAQRWTVFGRLGLHLAVLHLDTLSGGLDWTHAF